MKFPITGRIVRFVLMLTLPQSVLLWWLCAGRRALSLSAPTVLTAIGFAAVYAYFLIRLHLFPVRRSGGCQTRITILDGGQYLISFSIWGFFLQGILYLLMLTGHMPLLTELSEANPALFAVNLVSGILFLFFLLLNGQLRILFTCYRLGIVKRLLIICNLWVPVVNLFLMKYLCEKAKEECDNERCRFTARAARAESNVCATKYPLIMVHGIGFRDLRYFNYWGRIPKELVKNGAVVYYGHQQAWGTIEDNAECIHRKILQVLEENHCGKVNIIAHSKGGLDSRYLITHLHMSSRIASLTTVSTPHRGSELICVLNRLPDGIYRFISACLDRTFSKFGDSRPDCYHASKQLAPDYCARFNEITPDSPEVYYQSYASVMKRIWSDSLLSIPNLIMDIAANPSNDGLVTEESAKWGTFKGTFRNGCRRGISHGDMIDLKREDYKGFDVIETYVEIVKELKDMGY